MQIRMRGGGFFRFFEYLRIRLLHHLLAEIHTDEIVLKNIVVEHVLGGFTEVYDPLRERGWAHAERHVLRVGGAGGMVVAANPADAAGDEMRVSRVLAFHEYAIAPEDRRRAVALSDLPVFEVDLRKNSKTPYDPSDRIPVHFHQFSRTSWRALRRRRHCAHDLSSFSLISSGSVASGEFCARMAPLWFFIDRDVSKRAQRPDRLSVKGDAGGRNLRAGRLIHERHELVGKTRHGAANADASYVRAPSYASHPAAFWHVAIHNRPPAA